MNIKKYFSRNYEKLREIYEIFRNTEYGKKLNLPDWKFKDYYDFKHLPLLDPRKVDFRQVFIPADDLWCFITSGVSGYKKTIYRDIGTIVGYPKEMDEVLRTDNVVFLHSKRREGESYYETHDVNHKRMYPRGIFAEYENRDELLKYAQKGDVLFIIEYPLMAEWICHQLESALESKEILSENIVKRKVYLELSGEPVTEKQVKSIVRRLEKIFQTEVEYFVTYGSNEIGHIGTYIPALHGSQVVYEVISSLFVEIINDEIVITPYKKYGTILFRYKTGDKGILSFKDDKTFLKVPGKSQEEGIIYVAGAQVSIPNLVSKIEKIAIDCPVGIECVKEDDVEKGKCKLNINVYVPQTLTESKKEEITHTVKQFIMDFAILSVENHLGMVTVDVQCSAEPIKKRWFIVDKAKEVIK